MTLEQYQAKQIDICKEELGFTPTYTVKAGDSYERIAQTLDYCFEDMRTVSDPSQPYYNINGLRIDPQTINYKPALLQRLNKISGVEGVDLHPGDELNLDLSTMEW